MSTAATSGQNAHLERLDHGDSLGDRLVRLRTFADHVPAPARPRVAAAIDDLAVLLGEVVAEDDPER